MVQRGWFARDLGLSVGLDGLVGGFKSHGEVPLLICILQMNSGDAASVVKATKLDDDS